MNALIFDCDGVLADTERDGHRVAFNTVFAEYGIEFAWSVEGYSEALKTAGGKERLQVLLTPEFRRQHGISDGEVDSLVTSWHTRKTEVFVAMLADGQLPPRPGVRRLAAEAAEAGWSLAVASTSAHASVRAVLKHVVGADLARSFTLFAGDDVKQKKPAPDIYLRALAGIEVLPSDAVVVEDSEIGVRAARAAALPVIATWSTYTGEEDLSGAGIVVDSLGEPGGPHLAVTTNRSHLPIVDAVVLEHIRGLLTSSKVGQEVGE
ncbi:HAD-IA family hydrolase [Mycolicibacterium sp. J2]|uniref:HAD-IA family hydrolase n=1 Tax=Mycolicibacterium sp. J2 TaxID=2993511 RepID=UPI00224A816D|nr:HAD-IA family hydrolase [Mycolicibacterium sp. J2]MCX2715280.1 HAD-IA family hydrolase [Mycolicibacterium sp. J2]